MMNLRCSQKLLRRMRLPDDLDATESTTALGDWYGTILCTRPSQIVLCMSERSRLCVPLYARDIDTVPRRLRKELRELLLHFDISQDVIDQELWEMESLCFASTRGPSESRSILGSLNDFTQITKVHMELEDQILSDLAEYLSKVPCGPLYGRFPRDVTCELLNARFSAH